MTIRLPQKDLKELSKKIKELPIDKKLQEHLAWIKRYRARKIRPIRKDVKNRLLKIADDIRFWSIQVAIENNDMPTLEKLAQEIYDRYEDRPKLSMGLSADEEAGAIGGVVILPPIKKLEENVAKGTQKKDNMETSSGTSNGVSE